MSRKKVIPLDKLEGCLNELFGLSDAEDSEDGNESDENEKETVFVETDYSGVDLLEVLGDPALSNSNVLHETRNGSRSVEITENAPQAMSPLVPDVPEDNADESNYPDVSEDNADESNYPDVPEDNADESNYSDSDDFPLMTFRNRRRGFDDDMSETDHDDDEVWKKVAFPHKAPIEKFDDVTLRPTQLYPTRSSPLAYFSSFFSDQVYSHIIEQTNLYATQNVQKDWQEVTLVEMKAFFGMLLLMGVHPLPHIDLYWSTDPLFRVQEIADVMTCKRFKRILRNLHLNDNTKMPKKGEPGYDKLFKIRPLIDFLSTAFQNKARSTSSQSIDECMIKFKGRSSLKQYMPKKPVKRGFKVWARCDSDTGYLFQFEIYTGKKEDQTETGLGSAVVKNLCKTFIEEGVENLHVAFDNFFSSTELLQDLYEHNIYSTATVRPNRTNLPLRIKSGGPKPKEGKKQPTLKLKKGEFKWRVNRNVSCFVWMDTKPVYILSTAFFPKDKVTCSRTQKDGKKEEISCPLGVVQYTKRMGGVDRFDQKRGSYPVARRSRRWWMRIFYFLIDAAITNAHILYAKNIRVRYPITNLQFRTILGRNLIGNFSSRKRKTGSLPTFVTKKAKTPESRQKSIYGIPDDLRLQDVGHHLPGELPTYRRCRCCSSKEKGKKSKIQCVKCGVALCIVPCFAEFHKP